MPSADVVDVLYEILLLIHDMLCLSLVCLCVCVCIKIFMKLFGVRPPIVQIGLLNVDVCGVNVWQYLNIGRNVNQHRLLNCLIADYEVAYFLARSSRRSDVRLTMELLRWIS